jgi:DNA uptake protein ComE-like DNA-binding protein
MRKIIKDYFSFNSRERVAIILLCCLMAFFWILPEWYQKPQNLSGLSGSELTVPRSDSPQRSIEISAKKIESYKPISAVKLFVFDPNDLSEAGWKKLGVRDKTIQTILHYRQKGGRFHQPEDLKKIWGMLPTEAERLIPFVSISVPEKTILKTVSIPTNKISKPVLINQATAAELSSLPGVSKSLAGRMIKFRDKIGGFQNLDQVRRTYGITDSIFSLISPLIILQE